MDLRSELLQRKRSKLNKTRQHGVPCSAESLLNRFTFYDYDSTRCVVILQTSVVAIEQSLELAYLAYTSIVCPYIRLSILTRHNKRT